MGAWGTGPMENDAALDFAGDLSDGPEDTVTAGLRTAMTGVLDTDDYIEGSDLDAAIAAAALVAARIDPAVPIGVNGRDHLGRSPFTVDADLRDLAARVFTRAFEPENNEWHELWSDGGSLDEVTAALAPFRAAVDLPTQS
ncbi:DUF4259 domain-containing protein [Actinomadura alba]|uniref:DUF4259 domain-containing protein n=1 Tax=Actinomadura alba TaxID=406431 RepID=A0ABR7LP05_9ACTN|nr:DUF4259 domain-containing protein [Actinomadura alba]MBC6466212.1 DUF4259 domain-containing protein [Actinomadura alba]